MVSMYGHLIEYCFLSFVVIPMELIRRFYCSLEPIMLYCMEDMLGGPKVFKVRTAVNLQVSLLFIEKYN